MSVAIRRLGPEDHDVWAAMSHRLFPHYPLTRLRAEIAALDGEGVGRTRGFGAFEGARPVGFAELGLRPHANGCDGMPVPFLEAIWVDPDLRGRGVGRALIGHLAAILRAEGHRELGSDAGIENLASHAAHAAWGFAETQRVVYFRKAL